MSNKIMLNISYVACIMVMVAFIINMLVGNFVLAIVDILVFMLNAYNAKSIINRMNEEEKDNV